MITQDAYNRLIDNLLSLEDEYYNQDKSSVTDSEFDSMLAQAKKIEKLFPQWIRADSPTQRIMGKATHNLREVHHKVPLLSLGKAMDFEELKTWLYKLCCQRYSQFFVECKHDGLACALHYHNGKFVQGITRGNGLIGNDVTLTCQQIESIPKTIDYLGDLEVRGEIFLTKSGLQQLNEYIKQYLPKENIKKNVRNAASGLLRDENPNPNKSQYLQFSAYMSLDNQHEYHSESMQWLHNLGFKITNDFVSNFKFVINQSNFNNIMEKLKQRLNQIYDDREKLDFDIDGMVFKVNSYASQKKLGAKSTEPNWAIAYKFPQEEKISILRGVRWDLGAKGNITPIAITDPVNILGAEVTNPTLHNIKEIERLDVRIGDHVVVTRRGDVIPKIISVVKSLRTGEEKPIPIITQCPVCHSPITYNDVFIRCDNENCKGRIAGKVIDFVSKLDIKDFGNKLIIALVNANKINRITDIYRLKHSDIASLEKQGDVSAKKILDYIQQSKETASTAKIISGLGIPHVGETLGRTLTKLYPTLKKFKLATYDALASLVGNAAAQNIIYWLEDNQDLLNDMIELNLGSHTQNINGKLKNMTFAFTGTLSSSRKKVQDLIVQNGGIISSIKQGLKYLVIGDGAKQHKIDKAKQYGAKVIDEEVLIKLLN